MFFFSSSAASGNVPFFFVFLHAYSAVWDGQITLHKHAAAAIKPPRERRQERVVCEQTIVVDFYKVII